jgi:YesN/AraC family two-component response regulator
MIDIKKYLEYHLSRIRTVADLSRMAGISAITLRKNFRRHEPMPLGDYIDKLKVDVMKEFLIIGDDPCNWICVHLNLRADTGAKLFKRYTGETMKQFRERHHDKGIGPMIKSNKLNTQAYDIRIKHPPE